MTYTDRNLAVEVIGSIDGNAVHFEGSWSFGTTPERVARLVAGTEYLFESRGFNTPSGMATIYRDRNNSPVVDEWIWHESDEDLDATHQKWLGDLHRKREESWARNQVGWSERESRLPLSLRRRLARFRVNGGHQFEVHGWGYELVCCELAVLYAESGQDDSEAVMQYAHIEGTSGNQHEYAKMLSRHLTEDPADEDLVANSVSALTPITGNPDYSAQDAQDRVTS